MASPCPSLRLQDPKWDEAVSIRGKNSLHGLLLLLGSSLWLGDPKAALDHLLINNTKPGGIWQDFEPPALLSSRSVHTPALSWLFFQGFAPW